MYGWSAIILVHKSKRFHPGLEVEVEVDRFVFFIRVNAGKHQKKEVILENGIFLQKKNKLTREEIAHPDWLCRSCIMQYPCGYCKLEYLWGLLLCNFCMSGSSCYNSCSVSSKVLQLALATVVLCYVRPTLPSRRIWMCNYPSNGTKQKLIS